MRDATKFVDLAASVLPRPPRPRQGRTSSRPNSLVIIVSAAKIARHRPPQRHTRAVRDPKISIGRARPNGCPSCPRFPPWEAFERRPRTTHDRPAQGPASETLHQQGAGVRNPSPEQTFPFYYIRWASTDGRGASLSDSRRGEIGAPRVLLRPSAPSAASLPIRSPTRLIEWNLPVRATMTVVSIVFAILLMTLTLASTQFSPRILVSLKLMRAFGRYFEHDKQPDDPRASS